MSIFNLRTSLICPTEFDSASNQYAMLACTLLAQNEGAAEVCST